MITQAPKRELELSYPIEAVKNSIQQVCRLAAFRIIEKNESFGIYKISIVKGISVGMMNASLSKTSEEKTKAVFEIFNARGGTTTPTGLSSLQDYFLDTLAKHLDGKIVIKDAPKSKQKKGCTPVVLFVAIALLMITYLIF